MIALFIFILSAAASSVLVRGPSGAHPLAYAVETLTDDARWDPLAPAGKPHKRRILVSIFSPLDVNTTSACQLEEPIPYLPSATATTYRVIMESLGLPKYLLDDFTLQFCKPALQEPKLEYPVIIFSPAFSNSRLLSSAQAQSLASHGFTVITIDHPYDATIVEFPSGEVVYGFNMSGFNDQLAERVVEVRAADVSFLIKQLPRLLGSSYKGQKQLKVFVYGHSLGGSTAALAASRDSHVLGGLDFDGSIYGSVNATGLNKPFILAGNPVPPGIPITVQYDDFYGRLRGEKMHIAVNGTEHISFCDAPLLVALRHDVSSEQRPAVEAVLGTIDGRKLAGILDGLLVSAAQLLFSGDTKGLCGIGGATEELLVLEEALPCSK